MRRDFMIVDDFQAIYLLIGKMGNLLLWMQSQYYTIYNNFYLYIFFPVLIDLIQQWNSFRLLTVFGLFAWNSKFKYTQRECINKLQFECLYPNCVYSFGFVYFSCVLWLNENKKNCCLEWKKVLIKAAT